MRNNKLTFKVVLFVLLALWLVGCQEDSPEEKATSLPSPTLTPTPAISGYTGPVFGGGGLGGADSAAESEAACSADSGCVQVAAEEQPEAPALPLTVQTIEGFQIGIPEGYSPVASGMEVFITAISPDTVGGFTVSVREVNADTWPQVQARFDNPDFEKGESVGNWQVLPTDDYGAIALLTAPDGKQIFVEAFANPGYWPAFQATLMAMLPTIIFV